MNKLNNLVTSAFVLVFAATVYPTLSFAGADGSGGGAQIAASFRARSVALIASIAEHPEADMLCSTGILNSTLETTDVLVVNALIDPKTQKPVEGQNLDAWTTPGQIQLLQSRWLEFFDRYSGTDGRGLDVLILHEIYRATAGVCDDENFKISQRIPTLLGTTPNGIKSLTRLYKFTQVVAAWADDNGHPGLNRFTDYRVRLYCDQVPLIKGQELVCLEHYQPSACEFISGSDYDCSTTPARINYRTFSSTRILHLSYEGMLTKRRYESERIAASFSVTKAQTIGFFMDGPPVAVLQEISPEQPFYVLFDLESKYLKGGFDPLRMKY